MTVTNENIQLDKLVRELAELQDQVSLLAKFVNLIQVQGENE
ncbi:MULTISPECIES: hypothetical protein [Pseudomonas]|nr:hypothetical protein [Pseudomonas sp. NBRC 111136]